ncbi:hypothetical protein PHMEG_0008512 [Phytophthora megakarya]|uniref:Uncharacterized protein n=1 Tax=Phytophthora megakarya TaxID=4795 RepID=A0A225WIK5_9STRA|nr:hypothetical protein PHMEG_0008512 [Phytophthora megakarya]
MVTLLAVFALVIQRPHQPFVPARIIRGFLSNKGNSASIILSKISHLSWHHRLNIGFSVSLCPGHKLALLGMRRNDRPSSKKYPVIIRIIRALRSSLHFNQNQDRVIWGAAVLSIFYLLRCFEYLARGQNSQPYAITRADVVILNNFDKPCLTLAQASKVTVRFRGSKIDLFGEGTARTLARSGSAWICPVEAAWLLVKPYQTIGASSTTSLLCQVSKGNKLHVNEVVTALRTPVSSLGEAPVRFGSHSCRSGGATALFNAGVDSLAVNKFDSWRSDAVRGYTTIKSDITTVLAQKVRRTSVGNLVTPFCEAPLIKFTFCASFGTIPHYRLTENRSSLYERYVTDLLTNKLWSAIKLEMSIKFMEPNFQEKIRNKLLTLKKTGWYIAMSLNFEN